MKMQSFMEAFQKASHALVQFDWTAVERDPGSVKAISYEALRVEAFKLESLGRIFRKTSKKASDVRALGEALKTCAKFVEDALGAYIHVLEMAAAAEEHRRRHTLAGKLGPSIEQAKVQLSKSAHLCLAASFEIETILDALSKKSEDLRRLYLKGLVKTLSRIRKRLKDIDPEALEDGTHELRRQLRWAIMGVVYPSGLFHYENPGVLGLQKKYLNLQGAQGGGSIPLNAEPLVFLSRSVGLLGRVKDQGLEQHFFTALLSPHRKDDINKSFLEAIKTTEGILQGCRAKAPLKSILHKIKKEAGTPG